MCCLFLGLAALGPRFAVLAIWIFGDRVDLAFDSWFWPLLGLLFAPWTTLAYLVTWDPGGVGVGEWLLILVGVVADIATYASRAGASRYRRPAY
jgi:hypothetical protein